MIKNKSLEAFCLLILFANVVSSAMLHEDNMDLRVISKEDNFADGRSALTKSSQDAENITQGIPPEATTSSESSFQSTESTSSDTSITPDSNTSSSTESSEDPGNISSKASTEATTTGESSTHNPGSTSSDTSITPDNNSLTSTESSEDPGNISSKTSTEAIATSESSTQEPGDISSKTSTEAIDTSESSTQDPGSTSSEKSTSPDMNSLTSTGSTEDPGDISSKTSTEDITTSERSTQDPGHTSSHTSTTSDGSMLTSTLSSQAPETTDTQTSIKSTTNAATSTGSTQNPGNTYSPISTKTTPEPTTPKPEMPRGELLEHTDETLTNISKSIASFLDTLNDVTPAPVETTTTDTIHSAAIFISHSFRQLHKNEREMDLQSICDESDQRCAEFIKPLLDIQVQLAILTEDIDKWEESNLNTLSISDTELAKQVDEKTNDLDFMTNVVDKTAAESELKKFNNEINDAKDSVDTAIDDLTNNNNKVIFVAVFSTIGGLIVIALIIGLTFTFVKSRQMKKNNKGYSQVPEENVPINSFLEGQTNMAYTENEHIQPQKDSYPLQNVSSKQTAPTIPIRDPYAKSVEVDYRDPYTKPHKYSYPMQNVSSTQTAKSMEINYQDPYTKSSSRRTNDSFTESKSPDHYYATPERSRADDYYSRDGSRGGGYQTPRSGSSKPDDPFAKPTKGPNQGGLRRYY